MAVADSRCGETRVEIEIRPAVLVPDGRATRARPDEWFVLGESAHPGALECAETVADRCRCRALRGLRDTSHKRTLPSATTSSPSIAIVTSNSIPSRWIGDSTTPP